MLPNMHTITLKLTFLELMSILMNQVRAAFFEIALVRASVCVSVCVSVCPPSRALITSSVIWCDIGRVQLVKQILRLSPAFNYLLLCSVTEL